MYCNTANISWTKALCQDFWKKPKYSEECPHGDSCVGCTKKYIAKVVKLMANFIVRSSKLFLALREKKGGSMCHLRT